MNIRLTDARGAFADSKLSIFVKAHTELKLKHIEDVTLVSPQAYKFTYEDILDPANYNFNSSITLTGVEKSTLEYWFTETQNLYSFAISTKFNPKVTLKYDVRFKAIDYCEQEALTNSFKITLLPNVPPKLVSVPESAVFYEGQLSGLIPTAEAMFSDPGDTFIVYTTQCIEQASSAVSTRYRPEENCIRVEYPARFHSVCTLAVVAKDSVSNLVASLMQIHIKS